MFFKYSNQIETFLGQIPQATHLERKHHLKCHEATFTLNGIIESRKTEILIKKYLPFRTLQPSWELFIGEHWLTLSINTLSLINMISQ